MSKNNGKAPTTDRERAAIELRKSLKAIVAKSESLPRGKLVKSPADLVMLGVRLDEDFGGCADLHMRVEGTLMTWPKTMETAIAYWRRMRVRHKQDDLRHSEEELAAVEDIATFCLQTNAKLRGQPIPPPWTWTKGIF